MPPLRAERLLGGPLRLPQTRRLTLPERTRLLAEILSAYASTSLALHRMPIESALLRLRIGSAPAQQPIGPALAESCRLGVAVARTLRLLPGDTRCLVRSLVLTRLLARRGIACTLVIGTRTSPGFLAHAWVEHAGTPVLDPGDGSFARLVEL
jgi:hypothetical protein